MTGRLEEKSIFQYFSGRDIFNALRSVSITCNCQCGLVLWLARSLTVSLVFVDFVCRIVFWIFLGHGSVPKMCWVLPQVAPQMIETELGNLYVATSFMHKVANIKGGVLVEASWWQDEGEFGRETKHGNALRPLFVMCLIHFKSLDMLGVARQTGHPQKSLGRPCSQWQLLFNDVGPLV